MIFDKYITRYEKELRNSIIPFWEKYGIDPAGGYNNCLDREGRVYDTEKHMWIQWRCVYTFSVLYTSEFSKPQYLEYAKQGADFLMRHGKNSSGNYYFALNKRGEPSTAPYSIYSDCFAAMGCAALYRASGIQKYADESRRCMTQYIERIPNPKGKWDKSENGRTKRLTLGHYMILANLGQVLNECLGTTEYERHVRSACTKVLDIFWNPELEILFENVNTDNTFDLDSTEGRHINPGHGLEALWFIMQYAEKTKDSGLIEKCVRYTQKMLSFGWDKKYGGLYYFLDACGRPQVELQWDRKLWWVHNEAALAALYAFHLTHSRIFLDWFKKTDSWMWKHFPDKNYGEWYAYLNRRGEAVSSLKAGKWKCFFHLPRYLLTAIELMKKERDG